MGSLWEGAKLDVKSLRELPTSPKLFIDVPSREGEDKVLLEKTVLKALQLQNSILKTDTWSVVSVG